MLKELPICTHLTSIDNIKKLMAENKTNEVLVVDTIMEKHLLGMISDDDISASAVGLSVLPSSLNAEQCMRPVRYTIKSNASLEECQAFMHDHHLTKVAVVDEEGHVCGIFDQEILMRNIG